MDTLAPFVVHSFHSLFSHKIVSGPNTGCSQVPSSSFFNTCTRRHWLGLIHGHGHPQGNSHGRQSFLLPNCDVVTVLTPHSLISLVVEFNMHKNVHPKKVPRLRVQLCYLSYLRIRLTPPADALRLEAVGVRSCLRAITCN